MCFDWKLVNYTYLSTCCLRTLNLLYSHEHRMLKWTLSCIGTFFRWNWCNVGRFCFKDCQGWQCRKDRPHTFWLTFLILPFQADVQRYKCNGGVAWYITRVPTLPVKPGILSFTFPGLEFAQKLWKTWNFNSEPGKNLYFVNFVFQDSLFKIFIAKICMKVPGIWQKKTWTNLEFRTKNLGKTWNFVFRKKWEPWLQDPFTMTD